MPFSGDNRQAGPSAPGSGASRRAQPSFGGARRNPVTLNITSYARPQPAPEAREADVEEDLEEAKGLLDEATNARDLSFRLTDAIGMRAATAPPLATYAAALFLEKFRSFPDKPSSKQVLAYASLCNRWCKPGVGEDGRSASRLVAQRVLEGKLNNREAPPGALAMLANAFGAVVGSEADLAFAGAIERIARQIASTTLTPGLTRNEGYEPRNLANLANAFGKVDRPACRDAIARIARHVADTTLTPGLTEREGYEPKHLSNLANAFSKHPDLCAGAIERIAGHIENRRRTPNFDGFAPQALGNLANAFTKLDRPVCTDAIARIAEHVASARSTPDLDDYDPQALANLANAFNKVQGQDCTDAVVRIAEHVADEEATPDFARYNPQALANLAGDLGKVDHPACAAAVARIAAHVADAGAIPDLSGFKPQELANLANGCSKVDHPACARTIARIAAHVANREVTPDLKSFDAEAQSNLANAFCKVRAPACAAALTRVAEHVASERTTPDLKGHEPVGLANLANAFSKLKVPACATALQRIAAHVADQASTPTFKGYKLQELTNLANAFSKLPSPACAAALARIAGLVADQQRKFNFKGFKPGDLAKLANAFSKVGSPICIDAIARIAAFVADKTATPGLHGYQAKDLANLANAFTKLPKPPAALLRIAEHIADRTLTPDFKDYEPRHLSNLANAFGKMGGSTCAAALARIAAHVADRTRTPDFEDYEPQNLSNLANAFSKYPGAFDNALARIAEHVADEDATPGFGDYVPQNLANLANAFDGVDRPACADAIARIAGHVADEDATPDLGAYKAEELASLANSFSKRPEAFAEAITRIAGHVADEEATADLDGYDPHALANLANSFSKLPEACAGALARIAERVADRTDTPDFDDYKPKDLASLANSFSKSPEACADAIARIAEHVADAEAVPSFAGYKPQDLANLANSFSKRPEACADALLRIAEHVASRAGTPDFAGYGPQDLANLANALGKLERPACTDAIARIAEHVASRTGTPGFAGYKPKDLASLANTFSKSPAACADALLRIAEHVADRRVTPDFAAYKTQDLANLANAFSKRPEVPGCVAATVRLVREVRSSFGALEMIELAQLAGAAGALLARATLDTDDRTLLAHWFERLSSHLVDTKGRLAEADARALATLLKALRRADKSAGSRDCLTKPARPILARLEALRDAGSFDAVDLETLGHLASALVPLFISAGAKNRTREDYPKTLGVRALRILESLQPAVSRKLDLLERDVLGPEPARGAGAGAAEAYATRIPALSVIQLLESYEVAASKWRTGVLPSAGKDKSEAERQRHNDAIRARGEQLQSWFKARSGTWQEFLVGELNEGSWAFFAKLADDDLFAGLDAFGAQNAERIAEGHAPAAFDLSAALAEMDHEPRPPSGDQGLFRLQTVDVRGQPLGEAQEARYTIVHRLTQGALPLLAVQMPATFGAHLLARVLRHEGVPYRKEMFGGSAMKGARRELDAIMAEARDAVPRDRRTEQGGKLLAVPWADTLPDAPFLKLLAKLLPYKEAFYYFQRMMRPSPPDIPGLGPHDHVLEGRFDVMSMPDRKPGEEHPFRLKNGIALQPHDGCGFIRKSVADRMPMMDKVRARAGDPERRVKAFAENKLAHLPHQATQHFPRSEAVRAEVERIVYESLTAPGAKRPEGEALHRVVTAGAIRGEQAVAVPSRDGRVHVPRAKAGGIEPGRGLLAARSPYPDQNVRPIPPERVRTGDDATARFLDECSAIQYTMVGEEDAGRGGDDPMYFAKGVMVVVPDELWPTDGPAADSNVVLSAEDTKTHSDWVKRKDRDKADTARPTRGILLAHDYYAPGSLVAMPPEEQAKLSGDFDGDTLLLIAHLSALFDHVSASDLNTQERGRKPVSMGKTHTPAFDEKGAYQPGRGPEIMSLQGKVLEGFSGLQNNYLPLDEEKQAEVARQALLGSFEGFPPGFRRTVGELLRAEKAEAGDAEPRRDADETIAELQRTADTWRQEAKHPAVATLAKLVADDLDGWRAERAGARDTGAAAADDAGQATLPEAVTALLPDQEAEEIEQAYAAARSVAERVDALLGFPNRMDPPPDVDYDGQDLRESFVDLLGLGIMVGTDAFKSKTGTPAFKRLAERLQGLIDRQTGGRPPPYAKSVAREIAAGTFDAEAALARLLSNPTLAASVMEGAIAGARRAGLLPLSPPARRARGRVPTAEEFRASAVRRQAVAQDHQDEVTAAVRRAAAASDGVELKRRRDDVRSVDSLEGQLRSLDRRDKLDDLDGEPIENALRFSLVLPQDRFADAFEDVVDALVKGGHEVVRIDNLWLRRTEQTFLGVNVTVQAPDGYCYTVQVHTDQSYDAKEATHGAYKENQALDLAPDPARRAVLEEEMRAAFRSVERPERVEEVYNRRRTTVAPEDGAPAPSGPARQRYRTEDDLNGAADRVKPEINAAMRSLADVNGWGFAIKNFDVEMDKAPGPAVYVGKLKDRKRAAEKVRLDYGGDWSRLLDKVSGVVAVERPEDVAEAVRTLSERFEVVGGKNRWVEPSDVGYRDVILNLRRRGARLERDFVFEVQVHTKDSYRAKREAHQDFASTRTVDARHGGPPEGWDQARWLELGRRLPPAESGEAERAAMLEAARPPGWSREEWPAYAVAKARQAEIFANAHGEPAPSGPAPLPQEEDDEDGAMSDAGE